MKQFNYVFTFLIVLIFSNCKRNENLPYTFGEFNLKNIDNQIFKIKIGQDTVLKTRGGIILTLCKNTFIGQDGQEIEVSVKEVLTKKDIIKSGIPTISSDGRLLESGGMLNVLTTPRLPINADCPIKVKVPINIRTNNMQLFVADINNGETTWRLENPVNKQGNLLKKQ